MVRMGHSTTRAALIYQHATRERDRKITDGLSEQIKTARRSAAGRRHRAGRARNEHGERERCLISVTRPGVSAGQAVVETRGIEPLTPALQRRCSAN